MLFTRTVVKTFNPLLLQEQLASLGIVSISFMGFKQQSRREMQPLAASADVGERTVGGVRTVVTANPGDIEFDAPTDPGSALDAVLASHDHTQNSATQAQIAQRIADRATVASEALGAAPISGPVLKLVAKLVSDAY